MTAWVLTGLDTSVGTNKLDVTSKVPSNMTDAVFSADGTKLYITGNGASGREIWQYTVSSAWNITTATYSSKLYQDPQWVIDNAGPAAMQFKTDGTKLYISYTNDSIYYQYTLSTPWDISTATPDGVTYSPASGDSAQAMRFKSDGTKFFVLDDNATPPSVFSFTLGTAWNISTASLDAGSFDITNQVPDGFATGMDMKTDGTKLYVYDGTQDIIFQYTMGTPYNLATCTYDSIFVNDVNMQGLTTQGGIMQWKSDGTRMFVFDMPGSTQYQYDLPATGSGTVMICSF